MRKSMYPFEQDGMDTCKDSVGTRFWFLAGTLDMLL